eukprot:TRINITY_DN40531_c0_g1_i1.p1 TRINITY_DN40531_c0_g1~~TRINITY_DN40531_c0_g1_i1.p1  ORF type:complete len:142 (-),score=22.69 TRINITY_DN40531_c0_g1_i1:160-585(-)
MNSSSTAILLDGPMSSMSITSNYSNVSVGTHLIYAASSIDVSGTDSYIALITTGSTVVGPSARSGGEEEHMALCDFSAPSLYAAVGASRSQSRISFIAGMTYMKFDAVSITCMACTYLMRGNVSVYGATTPLQTNLSLIHI